MKIGIVCYPSQGGSGVLATELGHQLALRGHEIHFITYEPPFRLRMEKGIFFHQVPIDQYDLFKYPDYALTLAVKIAEVSKAHDLDILHVHYAIPHATSAYLAKQLLGEKGPKVVTTLHGTDITLVGTDPAFFEIVKFSIERSDGVTTVSESLKNDTLSAFRPEKEIEVIPNFFAPETIEKKANKEKLLIHSSNFRPVKRTCDVVEIFARVCTKIPARLQLLGSGPDMGKVRSLVKERALCDRVDFLGQLREVDQYIAQGDLLLLPSTQESFGLAALEAMAYGVPVIASNVGGIPELIEDGVSGFLAPVGDIHTMAEKAIKLLSDQALHARFSEAAQKRAHTLFCATKIVPLYESYYENVSGH